eukprot:gene264-biopygen342
MEKPPPSPAADNRVNADLDAPGSSTASPGSPSPDWPRGAMDDDSVAAPSEQSSGGVHMDLLYQLDNNLYLDSNGTPQHP